MVGCRGYSTIKYKPDLSNTSGKAQEQKLSIKGIQTELAKSDNAAQPIGLNGADIEKVFKIWESETLSNQRSWESYGLNAMSTSYPNLS